MAKAGVNLYFHNYSYSFNCLSAILPAFFFLTTSSSPMQVLQCPHYRATVRDQVLIPCFHPVENAWVHVLNTYFTMEICFIPTSQSCWSQKVGTTQGRAGRELLPQAAPHALQMFV